LQNATKFEDIQKGEKLVWRLTILLGGSNHILSEVDVMVQQGLGEIF
jgi:hypothetical protein